jgi:CBS domain containing-hemolysin-like protein
MVIGGHPLDDHHVGYRRQQAVPKERYAYVSAREWGNTVIGRAHPSILSSAVIRVMQNGTRECVVGEVIHALFFGMTRSHLVVPACN